MEEVSGDFKFCQSIYHLYIFSILQIICRKDQGSCCTHDLWPLSCTFHWRFNKFDRWL